MTSPSEPAVRASDPYAAAPAPGGPVTDPYAQVQQPAAPPAPPPSTEPEHRPHSPAMFGLPTGGDVRAQVDHVFVVLRRLLPWVGAAAVVLFGVAIGVHSAMTDLDRTVPLGEATTLSVEPRSDLWLWVPEERPSLTCTASNRDGLDLPLTFLQTQLTSDDRISLYRLPTADGQVSLLCEPGPAPGTGASMLGPAALPTDRVGVTEAPPTWQLQLWRTSTRAAVYGALALPAWLVVRILHGVLRRFRVLPGGTERRPRLRRAGGRAARSGRRRSSPRG